MKKIVTCLSCILIANFCYSQVAKDSVNYGIPHRSEVIFILDGIPTDTAELKNLCPDDIESIYLLKESLDEMMCHNSKKRVVVITTKKDEYEAIVLDAGFDTFLATQQSKDFYSLSTLKIKNALLVSEWNSRCQQPFLYDPSIYEAVINYDPKVNYGLDVEYKLYMFFKFMQLLRP